MPVGLNQAKGLSMDLGIVDPGMSITSMYFSETTREVGGNTRCGSMHKRGRRFDIQ